MNWLKEVFTPFGLVKENIRSLLGFQMICRLLTVLVFFPLLSWLLRLLLVFNGTSVIAAYNLGRVKWNPLTWAVVALIALLVTIFSMFERFAIVDALHASRCRKRLTARRILHNGFDLVIERFRRGNWGLIPYTLVILHFGMLYDASAVTSFITIPGVMRESMQKYPWQAYLYYAGIALAIYLFLRWSFAIPIMMEQDDTSFKSARRESWQMTRGTYVVSLLVLYLFWLFLSGAVFVIAAGAGVFIWYLLSLWLLPGSTGGMIPFFEARYVPAFCVSYIALSWLTEPLILASFQAAYYARKKKLGMRVQRYTEEPDFLALSKPLHAVVAILLAVCVFFSGPDRFAKARWMLNTEYGKPLIMAHRGYSAAAPENTLPAFTMAIEEGFTAAELDVQMTKDGVIVVLHDSNLKRMAGLDLNIWDVTYEEIRDVDVGSSFSKEYAGTRIPTLDEVLKTCDGNLFLNIEIKRTGHDEGITGRVIDVIMENEYLEHCDITSQDYATIEEVKAINPDIKTAYTSIVGLGSIHRLPAADIISIQETFATYENISNIHNAGKLVFVWTVNEEDTMEQLITLNVDAILTNDPNLLKSVMDRYDSDVMNLVRRLQKVFA